MLDVQDLVTQFHTRRGTVHAVNGVSFEVRSGQMVGLVGESGCGKSVTVRSLIGLVRPPGEVVSGRVVMNGQNLLGLSRRRRRRLLGAQIGFVGQNPFASLHPVLRIEAQFANIIRAHRDVSRREVRALALQKLADTGIADPTRVLDGYAHELSGGMAQRVVIAIATALDPALVIADEPTTALDVTVQRQILDLIQSLLASSGRSMLLVTHDLGVVAQYCDWVVVMYAGKVVETGPVDVVLANPSHPYTAALLRAVPRPGEQLVGLRGRVPDLVDYPKGCPYHDRCTVAEARCASEAPQLHAVAGRLVSCHFPVRPGAPVHAAARS
jgi:oligopeptide/dipeptide ABC transporter ATP-binding protein